jgi:hypothetical protein
MLMLMTAGRSSSTAVDVSGAELVAVRLRIGAPQARGLELRWRVDVPVLQR